MDLHVIKNFLPSSPRKKAPTTLVIHATAGRESRPDSAAGAIQTLRERGLSYNYVIAKDGTVYKCCALSRKAYHAGPSVGPDGRGVNTYSVGVSLVNANDGKDPYTGEQYAALLELAREIRGQHPSIEWLTTHALIAPKRKTDPLGFPIDRLGRDVGLPVWRPTK